MKYRILRTKHDTWIDKIERDSSKAFWDGFGQGIILGHIIVWPLFILFLIWKYWR